MNISHQQKIETILNQMSLEQKIGQCVVVGMSGTTITNDLREAVLRYHCGGIRLSPFVHALGVTSNALLAFALTQILN